MFSIVHFAQRILLSSSQSSQAAKILQLSDQLLRSFAHVILLDSRDHADVRHLMR
jgi:hypothetical protein